MEVTPPGELEGPRPWVHNYSSCIRKRQLLLRRDRDEARWAAIAATPECKRWWAHMADLMPANPDSSPVSQPLREVFHID
jgi:L-rhamnose mutarotase